MRSKDLIFVMVEEMEGWKLPEHLVAAPTKRAPRKPREGVH